MWAKAFEGVKSTFEIFNFMLRENRDHGYMIIELLVFRLIVFGHLVM